LTPEGTPDDPAKAAYAHTFVILATASATLAGRPGARDLLEQALDVFERRFWDEQAGMAVDGWDRVFERIEPYRGANANMHAVEALLAAADATGRNVWRERAGRIIARIVGKEARAAGWRIPEHYDEAWRALPDYNRDRPRDRFRPFGVTPGHGLEWSRLIFAYGAAADDGAPSWIRDAAAALFGRAVADAWGEGGQPGFCYTTDFDGRPVVRQRLHWVAAEALAAAASAYKVTGEESYAEWYETWWRYVEGTVIDHEHGSWHHELTPDGQPAQELWVGKPDIYHAVQATLIPRLPVADSLAGALSGGTP
jgi:mannose/cellobiose epimerase-like protein (N-acyl-D-glucosamine 2-epimerase family)